MQLPREKLCHELCQLCRTPQEGTSKYGPSARTMSSLLGVPRNTVSQMVQDGVVTTKEGVNKLKKGEVEGTAFFESASQSLPDAKFVSRKTGKSKSILTRPLKELYSDFQAQAEHRISFSHFAKLRRITSG